MHYAVALRKNTYSLVKGMISFDQAGGGGEWKKIDVYNGAPHQSMVHLLFDVVRTKDFWRYFWRLKKL